MPRTGKTAAAAAALLAATAAGASTPLADTGFAAECRQAMDRMMAGMAIQPAGDADHDFAAMMVPHHQGAIDMAVSELKYGHDPRLRRIAQEIIVDQRQEIAVMRGVLDEKPMAKPASGAMPAGMVMP